MQIDTIEGLEQFDINDFTIVRNPTKFFKTVVQRLKTAKNVYIACLFMGHSGKAAHVVDILESRIKNGRNTVICLDKVQHLRFGDFIKDMKRREIYDKLHFIDSNPIPLLPNVIKEALSVFHDKVFIFDDEVCITGANLHDFYFTRRMDRYYLIKHKALSDYIVKNLFGKVLSEKNTPSIKKDKNGHPPLDSTITSRDDFLDLFRPETAPFTKIIHYSHSKELQILKAVLSLGFEKIYISTPYLNFPSHYIKLLKTCCCTIFTVNPKCNTFTNFGWFGRVLTDIYSYSTFKTSQCLPRSKIFEFSREGYSFHAKGIWCINDDFGITVIGSSNYNRRSHNRDHESGWLMVSNNKRTIRKWMGEIESFRKNSVYLSKHGLLRREFMLISILLFYILNKFL
ncbi:uncharacterized protein VICG_00246 [Vittaforma corneae ATCC 50505]|uniref:CDP-diacylglycerol--glycerol-3-phosphate 3-phosphatidyltransferase n=1 Tax=Vittaforma corneae (strain ATCC 50505) TaxID=993615 RepID=L2GQ13_VITCO|nr:uncharacterized protein VICG_00246 [Vittaforma corneae ATCC 50505]ELA42931.1 hypothetical protein VICG_00246 [Vittaforma corneae ATCC 50505]